MIDIFARYIDNKIVFEPRKRRGMTKGEYLRAVSACNRLNGKKETTADPKTQKKSVQIDLPF